MQGRMERSTGELIQVRGQRKQVITEQRTRMQLGITSQLCVSKGALRGKHVQGREKEKEEQVS